MLSKKHEIVRGSLEIPSMPKDTFSIQNNWINDYQNKNGVGGKHIQSLELAYGPGLQDAGPKIIGSSQLELHIGFGEGSPNKINHCLVLQIVLN